MQKVEEERPRLKRDAIESDGFKCSDGTRDSGRRKVAGAKSDWEAEGKVVREVDIAGLPHLGKYPRHASSFHLREKHSVIAA